MFYTYMTNNICSLKQKQGFVKMQRSLKSYNCKEKSYWEHLKTETITYIGEPLGNDTME